MAALTPDQAYHYGEPVIAMQYANGPICVYLSGNGPLGDRVDMVARQLPYQNCQVEKRGAGDRVLATSTLYGTHAELEDNHHAED
jgi:hypothetical protein